MIGPVLRAEIERTFEIVPGKSTAHELWFRCPECGDRSGHRSVNLDSGQTYCFRCGKGSNHKGFFLAWAKLLGYTFSADGGISGLSLEKMMEENTQEKKLPSVLPVKLPKGFTAIVDEPKSAYVSLIAKMAKRKNLLLEDFMEAGAGFTREDPRWEPFCIFPVTEYTVPVYYQGRTYVDEPDQPTKLFPSRDKVKYGAAYWVYNIDALQDSKVEIAIVVESILNVLSLRWKLRELGWTNVAPVCVFKHNTSRWQVQKITRYKNIKEVCLLFDHDAIASTWNNSMDLINKVSVSAAEMPLLEGNRKADPNDDVEAAIIAFEQRVHISDMEMVQASISGKMTKPGCDMVSKKCRS